MTPFQECQAIVNEFFEGDSAKIHAWWNTPNPLLGGLIPNWFPMHGREAKLLKAIKDMQEGNLP